MLEERITPEDLRRELEELELILKIIYNNDCKLPKGSRPFQYEPFDGDGYYYDEVRGTIRNGLYESTGVKEFTRRDIGKIVKQYKQTQKELKKLEKNSSKKSSTRK